MQSPPKHKSQNYSSSKPPKQQSQNDKSYWDMMIDGIVRPPRASYSENQLGNRVVSCRGKLYLREDHRLDHQHKKLDLTIYSDTRGSSTIILYMHGNSSSRLEALGLVRYLPDYFSLACFDFMGCGKNEEMDTISLGHREAEQTNTVVNFLKTKGFPVALWGRSMGAATALLYGKADFIVADSSFKSFKSLCKQVAKEHSPKVVPNCMITCFFPCVFRKLRKDIDKKANYDVQELDVREAVGRMDPKTVVVFMSGEKDLLISSRNSEKLFNICPCEQKHIKIFEGDHNSKRPQKIMQEVMQLIKEWAVKKNPPKIQKQQIVLTFE